MYITKQDAQQYLIGKILRADTQQLERMMNELDDRDMYNYELVNTYLQQDADYNWDYHNGYAKND